MPKPTEYVATVTQPKRNTPIKRQKAKELIRPVKLESSPSKSFINFIKSFGSPSPKTKTKKKTSNNFTNNNKEINKRLNEAKKQANQNTSPRTKKSKSRRENKPLKILF
jgi:hypothetical protein|tara:strand:+ start:421 stop:747 length:327 start_codon:yes stop_codon:yes gene_type:complete